MTREYRKIPTLGLPPSSTNPQTHQAARRKMRKKLRNQGYTEQEIAHVIERMHYEQDCARLGEAAARSLRYNRVQELDDSGFKPKQRDSLLHGAARATGDTAKALARRGTLAKWETGSQVAADTEDTETGETAA